jgi:hypothetical protein
MIFTEMMMEKTPKRCELCGHSRAAHIDGVRCALCGCLPARRTFVQDSFSFRDSIPARVSRTTRKR